ncbi:MAG: terminase small subunit [Bacteroides sp.]
MKGGDDMGRKQGITEQQQLFIAEYLIDLNATQAAIRAGYSPKTSAQTGYKLCHKSLIADAIARAIAARSRRTGITQDRVLLELARVAFINPSDVLDLTTAEVKSGANDDDLTVIAGVKVKYVPHKDYDEDGEPVYEQAIEREVKLCDKLRALDMLCRHLGMYERDRADDSKQNETGVALMPAVSEVPELSEADDE